MKPKEVHYLPERPLDRLADVRHGSVVITLVLRNIRAFERELKRRVSCVVASVAIHAKAGEIPLQAPEHARFTEHASAVRAPFEGAVHFHDHTIGGDNPLVVVPMRLLVAAVMSPLAKAIVAIKTRPAKLTEGPINKKGEQIPQRRALCADCLRKDRDKRPEPLAVVLVREVK